MKDFNMGGVEVLTARLRALWAAYNTLKTTKAVATISAAEQAISEFKAAQKLVIPFALKIATVAKGKAATFAVEEEAILQSVAPKIEAFISASAAFTAEELAANATLLANAKGLAKVVATLANNQLAAIGKKIVDGRLIEPRQGGVQSVDNLNNFYKRADEKADEILPPIIIGEVFIRIDTEVDVVQFIYAPEDNDYIGLDPKLQVIKANTRLYVLEDKDDNLYVSLDKNTLHRCTIPKKNIFKTPKNSNDLIALGLEKDIQILTNFSTRPASISTTIATIEENTIIEWSNTSIKLRPYLERFIENIWLNLATNANPKNINVSATCTIKIPAEVVGLLPIEEQAKYANEVGFNFTRIQLGKTGKQILLVEEFAAISIEDRIITEKEALKAANIQKNYNIKFNSSKEETPMSENEQIQVLEALSMLPDNILKVTQGLKFQKYSEAEMDEYEKKLEKKSRKKENVGGFYDATTNKIVIDVSSFEKNKYWAFGNALEYTHKKGEERVDGYNNFLQYVILHEIGHVVDFRNYEIQRKWLEIAYNKPDKATEMYAKFNAKEGEIKTISCISGQLTQIKVDCTNKTYELLSLNQSTPFMVAVKADGKAPTDYASTNNAEAFAECFALYFIFPSKLKEISPNVFNWFKNNEKSFK